MKTLAPLLLALLASVATASADKPNLVVILADDLGYGDLSCYGADDIATPHIDRMAREGLKFESFYAAPLCTPARASLLTGSHPPRTGMQLVFPKDDFGLNPNDTTLAELLRQQGYATAIVGKWHLGHHLEHLPLNHGFDRYYGIPFSNDMILTDNLPFAKDAVLREGMTPERLEKEGPLQDWVPLMRGNEIVEYPADQSTLTRRYTEESLRFIRENRDRPFLLYLAHAMPHNPVAASAQFVGSSQRGLYGDAIQEMDWSTGEILNELKKLGLDEKTLVIFTSDNGANKHFGGSNGELRGGKNMTYEGGMRVPAVAWWPQTVVAGGETDAVAGLMDILPTAAKLSGAPLPETQAIDGIDLTPLLRGEDPSLSHDIFPYFRGTKLEALRKGKWKLREVDETELFDLEADRGETRNLAAQHPEKVEELRKLMREMEADVKARSRPPGRAETSNVRLVAGGPGWESTPENFFRHYDILAEKHLSTFTAQKDAAKGITLWRFTPDDHAAALEFILTGGRGQVLLVNDDGIPALKTVTDSVALADSIRSGTYGTVLESASGPLRNQPGIRIRWSLQPHRSQKLALVLVDDVAGPWGFVGMSSVKIKYESTKNESLLKPLQ